MAGTVNIPRDLWDDTAFKDSEMSQREAWIWLNAEASWKARTVRPGNAPIDLQRGQLAASTRFMAKAWMWSEARVRRYLDMLENRRMIRRETDAGITIVTICNYEDIQNAPSSTDAAATQQPTQQRRTADANENKDEIKGKEGSRSSRIEDAGELNLLSPEPVPTSDPFDEFWKVYPKKVSKVDAKRNFVKAVKSGVKPQAMIAGAERYAAECVGIERKFIKQPDGWISARRWEDYAEGAPQKSAHAAFMDLQAEKDRKARENLEIAEREHQERMEKARRIALARKEASA